MVASIETGPLVIQRQASPRAKWIATAAVAVALVVSTAVAWVAGWQLGRSELAERERHVAGLDRQIEQLESRSAALASRNGELTGSLAKAQRQLQIDRTVYGEISSSLEASTNEIASLRKELNFYRSILSPTDSRAGIRIQDLEIVPGQGRNQYRYTLVLIQALRHESKVQGQVDMLIEGLVEGDTVTLPRVRFTTTPDPVNFKYFQKLQGLISLPPEFEPVRMKISVTTPARNAAVTERWYSWPPV